MLTFVHLSDIHFHHRDTGTQFDLDEPLRVGVLENLKKERPGGRPYDGILISGDVAFGGKQKQYEFADNWLTKLCQETGTEASAIFVVPGNHDVDRDAVLPETSIWNNHAAIRSCTSDTDWLQKLQTQLRKDIACDPLFPLRA